MTEQRQRQRIYSHITKSSFLHVEDALEIGKLRIFAGHYKRGNGSTSHTAHWMDVADARVLFNDMAWVKPIDYVEFKGTGRGDQAVSRVLKVKVSGDKVWFRLETGPGQVIGEGAVKPKGDPETVINVPFTAWDARKLAFAVLSYLQAWEVRQFAANRVFPAKKSDGDDLDQFFRDDYAPSGYEQSPDGAADQAPEDF